jgi:hypothetical protein
MKYDSKQAKNHRVNKKTISGGDQDGPNLT